jgi:chemotaxis protein MotB
MHRAITFPLVATAGLLLGGCVAQQPYDKAQQTLMSQEEQINRLVQEKTTAEQSIARQNARILDLENQLDSKNQQVAGLSGQIGSLRDNMGNIENRLNNVGGMMLDPRTDLELANLAAQNPTIFSYDSARGMIQVASDLTFGSGSDQVKPEATEALQSLAKVLGTTNAAKYDIQVVGHTDSQPLSRSRERFPSNRHLSIARAFAVSEAIQKGGIQPERLLVSGWGQYRPVVANNSSGGTAANRRVEIYLVPRRDASFAVADERYGNEPEPVRATPARDEYPLK